MTTYAASITDGATGLTTINLQTAKASSTQIGYLVTNPEQLIDPGAIVWKRQMAGSPYVDGEVQVNAKMQNTTLAMDILVLQKTPANLQTALTALLAILKQSFYVTVLVDATQYKWACWCADIGVSLGRRTVHAGSAVVSVSAPRSPVPVSGPI